MIDEVRKEKELKGLTFYRSRRNRTSQNHSENRQRDHDGPVKGEVVTRVFTPMHKYVPFFVSKEMKRAFKENQLSFN